MDAGGETLLLGNRREQLVQLRPLRIVEAAGERAFVLASESGQLLHEVLPVSGEVEGVLPAVIGIGAALDVPTVLEVVEEGDDAARQQFQLAAERLLAAAGSGGYRAKDACLRWGQVQGGDPFTESLGGVVA